MRVAGGGRRGSPLQAGADDGSSSQPTTPHCFHCRSKLSCEQGAPHPHTATKAQPWVESSAGARAHRGREGAGSSRHRKELCPLGAYDTAELASYRLLPLVAYGKDVCKDVQPL
jgi:hypothetical protein